MRTVIGKTKVLAFLTWCVDGMKYVGASQGEVEDDIALNISGVRDKLIGNNSVLDTELEETDVTVMLSLKKMGEEGESESGSRRSG